VWAERSTHPWYAERIVWFMKRIELRVCVMHYYYLINNWLIINSIKRERKKINLEEEESNVMTNENEMRDNKWMNKVVRPHGDWTWQHGTTRYISNTHGRWWIFVTSFSNQGLKLNLVPMSVWFFVYYFILFNTSPPMYNQYVIFKIY
jgi:hypothetical protein